MSQPPASAAFSAHAPRYTALRRRLVPGYDAFYGAAVAALDSSDSGPLERVLDLGAGTGLMAAHVAARHPRARFELLDGSAEMLEQARALLGERLIAAHVGDMALGLPAGPFDAVVSALAIHHLEDGAKRALYAAVHGVLAPGGMFVNAEQVAGPTAGLTKLYDERWESDCRALGASDEEISQALARRTFDRCAPVADQLGWLEQVGFSWADCVYKDWGLAVLVALKGND